MGGRNTGAIIAVLAILVLVLASLVVYAFVLKPAVTGYVVNAQNQGIEYALSTLVQASSDCKIVPITVGNTTTQFVDVSCLQQQIEQAVVG